MKEGIPSHPTGRHPSTAGVVQKRLRELRPQLAFDPNLGAGELRQWRQKVRRRLRSLLRLPQREGGVPAAQLIVEEDREGYRLQRWELYPDEDSSVTTVLLLPHGSGPARRSPAVICLPGSDSPWQLLAGEPLPSAYQANPWVRENAMALHLVRRGMAALIVENPATGSLGQPLASDWRRHCMELIWMGWSYEGLSVFHKLAALDWLSANPAIDPKRIAVCGHSLGAKPALHLGVLEPQRIRAVVWNSAAYDWRHRHVVTNLLPTAPWHYVPDFICWFDYLDLKAALAPTPLLVSEGAKSEEIDKVRRAYALSGKPGAFVLSYSPHYRRAEARKWDDRTIPEGIDEDTYLRYINATNEEHFFHNDVAVPWLADVLLMKRSGRS